MVQAEPDPPRRSGLDAGRLDAAGKVIGETAFAADIVLEAVCHLSIVRSTIASGAIRAVNRAAALELPGVLAVLTADDIGNPLWGRRVLDIPVLARQWVRFVGEPVAATVAISRRVAEDAAALVDVEYDAAPAVTDTDVALDHSSPSVHDAPWEYENAVAPRGSHNVQSVIAVGSPEAVAEALASARYTVERTYTSPSVHHGYIEPQACVASVNPDGKVRLWVTNKAPYLLKWQLERCLGLAADEVTVEPLPIGGDFGGKGGALLAPLCIAAAKIVGRPVKCVLRYGEDLATVGPRHSAQVRVRIGCDADGRFVALGVNAVFDGGAYAGLKPRPDVRLHGAEQGGSSYAIPVLDVQATVAYTNSVPRGHMRSPGAPQVNFAVECAIDELAVEAGLDPIEIRQRNLLKSGRKSDYGRRWSEFRGHETLEAALGAYSRRPVPDGWAHGRGIAIYDRPTVPFSTSMRLGPLPGGRVLVEVPFPETGTGSHSAARQCIANALELAPDAVEVTQVTTDELPYDGGVAGSRVTISLTTAAAAAAAAWRQSEGAAVTVWPDAEGEEVTSVCVGLAQVAVDRASGQIRVLELIIAADVADILNPVAHRLQIEGGAMMGYGAACLEDLDIDGGQVLAGTLGEFRLPTAEDAPVIRTVLVTGGKGLGPSNVKAIGELANVPVPAAVANAVANACGARVRDLPITAERVWRDLLGMRE